MTMGALYLKGCEAPLKLLLPNTKLTKNIIQLVFIGDLAGDLAEVLQTPPDIKGHKVRRNFIFQSLLHILQSFTHLLQCMIMPCIGDDHIL